MEHPWRDALVASVHDVGHDEAWPSRGGTDQIVGAGQSESVSLSESESKEGETGYGHEKLDVYRAAIEYVGWANRFCESLKGHRTTRWKPIPIPIPTPTPMETAYYARSSWRPADPGGLEKEAIMRTPPCCEVLQWPSLFILFT